MLNPLVHLYFGDGKGKTSSTIGLAIRAAGHGKKILFVQFMKARLSGELQIFDKIENIELMRDDFSDKFTFMMSEDEKKNEANLNKRLLEKSIEKIYRETIDVVVFDEIVTAVNTNLICGNELMSLIIPLKNKLEIVLTGSKPEAWMLDFADYVTEIKKIKHPFDNGVKARLGIEY